jgi:glycosyltransferase involved in cell wall biosynthesis
MPSVALGLAIWNGEQYLEELLNSVLNQDYRDFVLYVLDNQSTDKTQKILELYSKDPRIIVHIDTQRRGFVDAQKLLFEKYLVNHKYCAFVCDDDLYESNYLSLNINNILNNALSLSYCNFNYIDERGVVTSPKKDGPLYEGKGYRNSLKFFYFRNCIPLFFGVYVTEVLEHHMPNFRRVDEFGYNHENLMLFSLLHQCKVGFIASRCFSYRIKNRREVYKMRGYWDDRSSLGDLVANTKHNWRFSCECNKLVFDAFGKNKTPTFFMLLITPFCFLKYTLGVFVYQFILRWHILFVRR